MDDYRDGISDTSEPLGVLPVGGSITGELEVGGDLDIFSVRLTAGQEYVFDLQGVDGGGGTLGDPFLVLYNAGGTVLDTNDDSYATGSDSNDSQIVFTPQISGNYYLGAKGYESYELGSYTLRATLLADDYADSIEDVTSADKVKIGIVKSGEIERDNDADVFSLTLNASQEFLVVLFSGSSDPGSTDPKLQYPDVQISDMSGSVLSDSYDSYYSYNSAYFFFQSPNTATYYIEASSYSTGSDSGSYGLIVLSPADDSIVGGLEAEVLDGFVGNDTLNGGGGADQMFGSLGDDVYIASAGVVITENPGEGVDTIRAGVSWTLESEVENLILVGTSVIDGSGNALDNLITGNASSNTLSGGAGNDRLNGSAGADILLGGSGNDIYSVDNLEDKAQESTVLNGSTDAGGTDTVQSAVSFTLGSFLETLTLTGTGAINGTGNGLNNVITGTAGANTLNGGAGSDTLNGGAGADLMQGGGGNDLYVVENVMDKAQESTALNGSTDAGGADTVNSSVSFMLGSFVENLTLTGAAGINGTGNGLNNRITGNAGINTLNGGAGADTLLGGAGNDTYIVDNSADIINESITLTTEIDSVRSSVARTLGANFEVLILTGTAAIDATGNVLNNVLTGNAAANRLDGAAGNDTLDGGAGVDTLVGGVGDDRYIRSAGDVLQESANAGTDLVLTDSSCTLDPNLEQLALTGSSNIYGNGNELANTLTGNVGNNLLQGAAGNDTLNGGAGADTLRGGTGDDRYIRSAGDVLEESASAGTDLVISDSSFTLDPNFEQLALTGSSNLYGNGNQLANTLVGNSGNNLLQGSAGNDTLNGGIGLDTLVGGTGVDTFAFGTALDAATNVDTIRDWDAGGTQDRIALDDDVFLALGLVTTATALDPTMFVAGAAALDANDHIIYDQTTGAMYYDVDGAGGVGQVQFAILGTTSHPALGAGDFVVVG